MKQPHRQGNSFLSLVDAGEREVARFLTLITGVVIVAALIQLMLSMASKLLQGTEATWLGDDLIKVLGDLLELDIGDCKNNDCKNALEVLPTMPWAAQIQKLVLLPRVQGKMGTFFF